MGAASQPVVLLVEDNPADVRLTQEVLRESGFAHELRVARDGEDALAELRSGRHRPDLVLLDLNLPRKDGREVLREIKSDPRLSRIPVIVLTTSRADADVAFCYDTHANCFLTKPVDLGEFMDLAKGLVNFWLRHVQLAPHPAT